MAQAPEREHPASDQITFEVERLDFTAADRLVVSGRWSGVRGRRFVRPTLILLGANGDRGRALADLEDKPWAAEDGQPWTASFPLGPERTATRFELAVAPDIEVVLPAPGSQPGPRAGSGATSARAVLTARTTGTSASAEDGLTSVRVELEASRGELDRVKARSSQLEQELERAAHARTELRSALARRDAAVAKLDQLVSERDQAFDAAKRAIGERDAAIADAQRARREREQALTQREQALTQREQALTQRDAAAAQVGRIRAAASARMTQLQRQLRRQRPAVPRRLPDPATAYSSWVGRGFALTVLAAAIVAVLIVLQSP